MTQRPELTVFFSLLILTVKHNQAETHNALKHTHTHTFIRVTNPEIDGSRNTDRVRFTV